MDGKASSSITGTFKGGLSSKSKAFASDFKSAENTMKSLLTHFEKFQRALEKSIKNAVDGTEKMVKASGGKAGSTMPTSLSTISTPPPAPARTGWDAGRAFAAAGAVGYSMLPNTVDAVIQRKTAQGVASFSGGGITAQNVISGANQMVGNGATGPYGPSLAASNMLFMGGYTFGSASTQRLLKQTAGISAISGMSNEQVASGYSGIHTLNFLRYGFNPRDSKGQLKSPNELINMAWRMNFGNRNDITVEDASMVFNPNSPAYRNVMSLAGNNPELFNILATGLVAQARNKGQKLNSKTLKDVNKTFDLMGAPKDDPRRSEAKYNTSQARNLEKTGDGLVRGYDSALSATANVNNGYSTMAQLLPQVNAGLGRLKGLLETLPMAGNTGASLFGLGVGGMSSGLHLLSNYAMMRGVQSAVGASTSGALGYAATSAGATSAGVGVNASITNGLQSTAVRASAGGRSALANLLLSAGIKNEAIGRLFSQGNNAKSGLGRFLLGNAKPGFGGWMKTLGRGLLVGSAMEQGERYLSNHFGADADASGMEKLLKSLGRVAYNSGAGFASYRGPWGALIGLGEGLAGFATSGLDYGVKGGKWGGEGGPEDQNSGTAAPIHAAAGSPYGQRSSGFHKGQDYPAPVGTPVYAYRAGTVSLVRDDGKRSYGKHVRIKHDNGMESIYGHLSKWVVSAGQKVSAGQLIGFSGNTGNSTGPHLHFEVKQGGTSLNPMSILAGAGSAAAAVAGKVKSSVGRLWSTVKSIFSKSDTSADSTRTLSEAAVSSYSREAETATNMLGRTVSHGGRRLGYSAPMSSGSSTHPAASSTPSHRNYERTVSPASNYSGNYSPSAKNLLSVLKQAGFKGEALRTAFAVAMAESSGRNEAFNPHGQDRSFGLFQINMLGNLGPERLQKVWHGADNSRFKLSSESDLFDPLINARVAYHMSNHGRNWSSWTTFTKGKYTNWLDNADRAIANQGGESSGIGMAAVSPGAIGGASGLGVTSTSPSGRHIEINMNITLTKGSETDARTLANRVKDILKHDLERERIGKY